MNENQWITTREESGMCIGFSSSSFRSMTALCSEKGNDIVAFPKTISEQLTVTHPEVEVKDLCYRLQTFPTGAAEYVWLRVMVDETMFFMEWEQNFGRSGRNTVSRFSYHIFDVRKREDPILLALIAYIYEIMYDFIKNEGYFRLHTLYQQAEIQYPSSLQPYLEREGTDDGTNRSDLSEWRKQQEDKKG